MKTEPVVVSGGSQLLYLFAASRQARRAVAGAEQLELRRSDGTGQIRSARVDAVHRRVGRLGQQVGCQSGIVQVVTMDRLQRREGSEGDGSIAPIGIRLIAIDAQGGISDSSVGAFGPQIDSR